MLDNLWEYDVRANGVVLDVLAQRGDEDGFFEWLGYALPDGFDLTAYEQSARFPRFFETERYAALKGQS